MSIYPEFHEFKSSVLSVDNNLKKLFFSDFDRESKSSWWQKGILKEAGEEYVKDIREIYQIEVKEV